MSEISPQTENLCGFGEKNKIPLKPFNIVYILHLYIESSTNYFYLSMSVESLKEVHDSPLTTFLKSLPWYGHVQAMLKDLFGIKQTYDGCLAQIKCVMSLNIN